MICKVISQMACFHLYEENIAHRFLTSETETALQAMIHNAALDSTLISLRCFNEFFSSHRREDDVRASDFPWKRLSIQIVYFYQSNPDDNVFAAHNSGVIAWW